MSESPFPVSSDNFVGNIEFVPIVASHNKLFLPPSGG